MSQTENITGTVYLVGAGPGDPGLITVKGKTLLAHCNAVVYDDLVPDELLLTLPSGVEKHYVGKLPGRHCTSQEEINSLLVRLATMGRTVVRLKGGDPLIFGRGREEAEALKANGIRFEIVPGVTAGIAAPACAGIPCTDREKSSFVILATGHKAAAKAVSSVPWNWVAQAAGGTVVIYMGVAELDRIVVALVQSGMPPQTPAAIIERGTYPSQRVVTAPLADIAAKGRQADIHSPAIIVIGDVAEYHARLKWQLGGPLAGLRVMVTRPADQASEMYELLRAYGSEVLTYPTITTEESVDASAWQAFQESTSQGTGNSQEGWLLFTSENGVRYFLDQLRRNGNDVRTLARFKIASLGFGTAASLNRYGLNPDFVPTCAIAAALADELISSCDLRGLDVWRIRGNLGDDTVEQKLRDAGARVVPMQVYCTLPAVWPQEFKDKLLRLHPDIVIFTSGSTIDGLFEILGESDARRLLDSTHSVSIGPSTSQVLERHGGQVWMESKEHGIRGLLEELVDRVRLNPLRMSNPIR